MNLLEGDITSDPVMAGLATFRTPIVEMLHRFAGLRTESLRQMLLSNIDDVTCT